MRTAGFTAMIAVGALSVGFGAGWLARGASTKTVAADEISSDVPARKPMASASSAPSIAKMPDFLAPPSKTVEAACQAPPPAPFAWPSIDAPHKGMIAIDDTHFVLDRAFLEDAIVNQAELMKSARIVPEMVDGGVSGIRVFGVRAGTFLDRLGVRNGDRIDCLFGLSLVSPEQALLAYSKLRSATEFDVALVRDGKPLTLEYRVTGAPPPPSTSASAKPKKLVDSDNPF